jgi:peptidyl-prolyl cis-trans isomerase B (cyclophilin B)
VRKLAIVLASAVALSACGGSSSQSSSPAASNSSTAAASSTSTAAASKPTGARCRTVPVPAPKGPQHLHAPATALDPAKTYTVTVATNCGTFAFTLDVKGSPKTSASFYALVKRGFFDGLTFHRVAAGFVVQGGDPNGDGSGGPGYTVVEPPPHSTQYVQGDVAMAKTQTDPPGASGSQFFIVTAPDAKLPPDYAVAGGVVRGMDVAQYIGKLPVDGQDRPTSPVVIEKATLRTG